MHSFFHRAARNPSRKLLLPLFTSLSLSDSLCVPLSPLPPCVRCVVSHSFFLPPVITRAFASVQQTSVKGIRAIVPFSSSARRMGWPDFFSLPNILNSISLSTTISLKMKGRKKEGKKMVAPLHPTTPSSFLLSRIARPRDVHIKQHLAHRRSPRTASLFLFSLLLFSYWKSKQITKQIRVVYCSNNKSHSRFLTQFLSASLPAIFDTRLSVLYGLHATFKENHQI